MLESEEKIIAAAKAGEPRSFEKLYHRYLSPIYRFIYMKVSHRQETEDLAHEVFLTAWQNMKNYEFQGFPFSSWLYQIARNRVIDHYRLKKPAVSISQPGFDTDLLKDQKIIEEELDLNQDINRIKTAIQKLNHDQQDVVLMRFMEELSHREIALIIGKSEGAVRLIQHRALNELKKIFGVKKTKKTGS